MSEGFFLSMSTRAKSVLVAVPVPTHVCPGGWPCPPACPRGCRCSHTSASALRCTGCRMYGRGGVDAATGWGLRCWGLCSGGSRPGRFFSFLGCFEGFFSPPSPESPFSRDLYPALIKRSAVCAVLSRVSASSVGAARARPGLGKRGTDWDRRELP